MTLTQLSLEQRRTILQQAIRHYYDKGFRVVTQTDTTAQMVRKKEFSCLWFVLSIILLIGWLVYLLWYWSQKDQYIYVEVDDYGKVTLRT